MGNCLDTWAQVFDVIDGALKILQDQSALCVRKASKKPFEVVSFISTNVYNQGGVILSATGNGRENFTFDWKPFNPVFAGTSIRRQESFEMF